MDQLERGPLPISAIAPPNTNNNYNYNNNNSDLVDSEDEEEGGVRYASLGKLRGENSNMREFDKTRGDGYFTAGRKMEDFGNGYRRGGDFEGGNLRNLRTLNKRKSYWEGNEEEDEEQGMGYAMVEDGDEDEQEQEQVGEERGREVNGGGNLMGELAAQMRGFAERFVKIEKKKMDLMRDNQRLRNEMENKKKEMILVYQHKTLELINKVFDGVSSSDEKKMKMSPDL